MNIQVLFENKAYQFWALQVLGFGGYGVSYYLGVAFRNEEPSNYAFYMLIICLIGMGITVGLRMLYRFMWDMTILRRAIGLIVGSYIATVIWYGCRTVIFMNFYPGGESAGLLGFLLRTFSLFWVMAVWSLLYFSIKTYLSLQEEKHRSLASQALANEAQLKMLRYQLNPHFLFNTLNAISTLVLNRDNELANTMVTRLSRFLRYSLVNDPIQKVSLGQEIEALQLYLDIEKVRFDERLKVVFDVDKRALGAQVPSLLLQPLVENAIKYAIAPSVNGGTITIGARVGASELVLEVSDDGPGIEGEADNKGAGVGLSNTANRLQELYGENQSFDFDNATPSGLKLSIGIPLELTPRANTIAA